MATNVADRVQETWAGTGTGTVTLAGAATGYQSFATAYGAGPINVGYCITDALGNWEVGIGSLTSGVLTRTTVQSSSNANAAVNFPAGTKTVFSTWTATLMAAFLSKFAPSVVTAAPNATIHAVVFAADDGAATNSLILLWKGTAGFLAVNTPDNTSTGGNIRGNGATDFQSTRSSAAAVASGTGAALLATSNVTASGPNAAGIAAVSGSVASSNQSLVHGDNNTSDAANTVAMGNLAKTRGVANARAWSCGGSSQGDNQYWEMIGRRNSVFSTTPVQITQAGGAATTTNIPVLDNNSINAFTVRVVMSGGGDYWDQEIKGTITRGANAASTALLGVPVQTSYGKTAGATTKAWAITVAADTTNGGLSVTITGDVSGTVAGRAWFQMYQLF